MAKYVGIDYGSKRVGIALSDDTGTLAFPKYTFENDSTLIPRLRDLIHSENVGFAVIGESKNKDGKDNIIMAAVRTFAEALEEAVAVTIIFEPEYYSSLEARRLGATSLVDEKAAAVILNRYLERLQQHGDND